MADLSQLLTQNKSKVQFILQSNGGNTVIQLDCSVSEKHQRESPMTEFEVENGQTISDHQIVKPFDLDITGIITDTPLSLMSALITTAVTAVLPNPSVLGPAAAALALAPALASQSSPSAAAYLQLLNLQSTKQPLNIKTSLFLYRNMWITKISVPREAKTGKILLFDISFRQMLLVSPQVVNIQVFQSAALSAPQANVGKQEAQQLSAQAQSAYVNAYTVGSGGTPPP